MRFLRTRFMRIVGLLAAAALLLFWAPSATNALPAAVGAPTRVQRPAVYVAVDYYRDWFYSEGTCENWGNRIINPGSSDYIPGAIDFHCHMVGRDTKWSMDLYFLD